MIKKTANFHQFLAKFMDSSYTESNLEKQVDEYRGITRYVLRDNVGIYHAEKYKDLRNSCARFFHQNGFKKLAQDIVRFDNDGKQHLKACDFTHIQKFLERVEVVLSNHKLKEKFTRILAKYL